MPALIALAASSAPALAQEHHHQHAAPEAAQPASPTPPSPDDWAADAVHDPAEMATARAALFAATRDMTAHLVQLDRFEWQSAKGHDSLAWSGKAWLGGDIDRVLLRSEGEVRRGGGVEHAEARLLWSHAITPRFNLETGVRQDFGHGPQRTHATIGLSGMLPYWIEAETALFLSHKGEVKARAEMSHDMRLTQTLILQPRAEVNLSAQAIPRLGIGSGLTDAALGLRLRYAPVPEFAPYLGIERSRKFGHTARLARAAGERAASTRVVAGVRFWF